MKFRIAFAIFIGAIAQIGISGGIGGGNPPALEIESAELLMLKAGALNGDVFRVTPELGADPVYMIPQQATIKSNSLRAASVNSESSTLFYTPSTVETMQSKLSLSIARSIGLPGILPVTSDDLTPKFKPKVEVVPASTMEAELQVLKSTEE